MNTITNTFRRHAVEAVASVACALIRLRGHQVAVDLGDGEPHLYVTPRTGLSIWHFDAWADAPELADEEADGGLNVQVLGAWIEVYWVRRPRALHVVTD